MPNDEKPIVYPDREEDLLDVASEELEEFGQCLAWTLTGLVNEPADDGASVNVSPLDDADRKTLLSLGTPEEFVSRTLARLKTCRQSRKHLSTHTGTMRPSARCRKRHGRKAHRRPSL